MIEKNDRAISRNIVVFGQTGAGKSSIINMLASSHHFAKESGGADGCTTSNNSYFMSYGGHNYTFWDTAGLNGSEASTVSPQAAVQNLLDLVKDHNVNLLIYCIRGRLVDITRLNYDLFWRIICRKEVPVVLVVTELEGKDNMDEWWRENQKTIKKMKMSFDGHACITSWKGPRKKNRYLYEKKYRESAEEVWKLVGKHCRPSAWCMPPEWPVQAQMEIEKHRQDYYNVGNGMKFLRLIARFFSR